MSYAVSDDVLEKVILDLKFKGLFSEYLPSNFNLKSETYNIFKDFPVPRSVDYIEPYKFTMSRSKDSGLRRVIQLPEITAYVSAVNYMEENGIIKELINFSAESENSFSKIIREDGEILKHETIYGNAEEEGFFNRDIKSNYIPNVIEKVKRAQGAKGILYLDISNFYGSVYTHIFPAILLGYEEAMNQYKYFLSDSTDTRVTDTYKKYEVLDKKVRGLNSNRTNGLLTGPLLSFFLAEAILTRIDKEIKAAGVSFVRFVDDFEIFIYEENDIERSKRIISDILGNYYLTINSEKSKFVKFPYYVVENLQDIYEEYINGSANSVDLIKLFNNYFNLENNGTKGAISYLVKSIDSKFKVSDPELYASYLFNILVNDGRSLIKVCELIIKKKIDFNIDQVNMMKKLLIQCIRDEKDLEVIWLVYLLKNIGVNNLGKDIIKKIVSSRNDLAIIIIINEYEEEIDGDILEEITLSANSWILLYQLFLKNFIIEDDLVRRVSLKRSKSFYSKLKYEKFTFYKPISEEGELPF